MDDVCALRKGMIAELDTVNQYKELMKDCKDPEVKRLFESIIGEELVHVGEFQYMVEKLCSFSKEKIQEGKEEAEAFTSGDMLSEF